MNSSLPSIRLKTLNVTNRFSGCGIPLVGLSIEACGIEAVLKIGPARSSGLLVLLSLLPRGLDIVRLGMVHMQGDL